MMQETWEKYTFDKNLETDYEIIKQLFKNKFVGNASWLIFGRVMQMLISFVISRSIGRENDCRNKSYPRPSDRTQKRNRYPSPESGSWFHRPLR